MTEKLPKELSVQMKLPALSRQRNFFAGCMALLVCVNFILVIKLAATSEKIIMVPGISKEMIVEADSVSSGYLEESTLLFLSALLDLTPTTIETKKDIIFRHTSTRSPASLKQVQEYFAEAISNYKKFQLSTFFAPKKLHISTKDLQVIAEGVLTSNFGKRGFEEKESKYKLSFDYVGGYLLLKEFVELKVNKELETG